MEQEPSEEKFDATKLVHLELRGRDFIDGVALGEALEYTNLARLWKRIARAESSGRLGYVMWRRDEKGVVSECALCPFSALRIALRTRSRTAIAVSKGLAEFMCGANRIAAIEAVKRDAIETAKREGEAIIEQFARERVDREIARLEERVTQKKLELEAAHANTLPPANEPAHEVAALRARLLLDADANPSAALDADRIRRAQLYIEALDDHGPAGRTWWRKDGARRIAYAAQLRRLLTSYHCPLRAMKSQVFAEMCDLFSWGGKERPWRLLPASWVWQVNLALDCHIDESLERLESARDKHEQRHTV